MGRRKITVLYLSVWLFLAGRYFLYQLWNLSIARKLGLV